MKALAGVKALAVVIPARNEEATIGELLDRVGNIRVPGWELCPIVVDDGSTDRTAETARKAGAVVIGHRENRGLGAAVRTGLRAAVGAGAGAVAYLDADLEYFPEDIPALVEPIHGSAPDIAGKGVANPSGAIWAGALMLEHVGHPDAGERVLAALEDTLAGGTKTRDLGGFATTQEMTDAVIERLRNSG